MRSDITIVFDTRRSLDLNATVEPSPQRQSDARDWFDSAWETLGCEPLRPSGKVLLLDKVLGVADALGYDVLSTDEGSARVRRTPGPGAGAPAHHRGPARPDGRLLICLSAPQRRTFVTRRGGPRRDPIFWPGLAPADPPGHRPHLAFPFRMPPGPAVPRAATSRAAFPS